MIMLRLAMHEDEDGAKGRKDRPGFIVANSSILEGWWRGIALEDGGEIDPLEGRDGG